MESVQETFILEKLNNYNTCELLDNKTEIYNLNEISSNLSMILNKESVSGYDMKAVFYLFDVLFLSRSKTKIREKGLYNLSKTIKKCVKKMEQIEVKSKEGLIYITHFFSPDIQVVIKIPQNSNGIESKMREYFIGIESVNRLRYIIPTFVYTLGAFLCHKPSKTGKFKSAKSNKNTAFVLYEKIPGDSVHTLLKNENMNFKEFLILLFQLLLGLEVAQREVRFTHFDLHTENIMVRVKGVDSYSVPLDMKTYSINNPESIPVVIDFGASTTYIDGKTIGSYDYIKHGMLNFMVPGHDMYKFIVYCARKSVNKELKDNIISLFRFYGSDDPYSIIETRDEGIDKASSMYCKDSTFSGVANYTPLMLMEWIWKEFSDELSPTISVTDRKHYLSVQYSNIIKDYEDIFTYKKSDSEKSTSDEAIFLVKESLTTIPSYVMSKYNINILKKYNSVLCCKKLEYEIDSLNKLLKNSTGRLINYDMNMLEKVFDIKTPLQKDLDDCLEELFKIKIRYPNALDKQNTVKKLENILLYQDNLNEYMQFYFTILELGLSDKFDSWLKEFTCSSIYLFHVINVTQIERAIRWGQTLMSSII